MKRSLRLRRGLFALPGCLAVALLAGLGLADGPRAAAADKALPALAPRATFWPGGEVHALALSADGKTVSAGYAAWGRPAEVQVWDANTGAKRYTHHLRSGHVSSLALNGDGTTLAAAGSDLTFRWETSAGLMKRYTAASGKARDAFPKAGGPAAMTADGRLLVCGAGNAVKLWDGVSGKETRTLAGHKGAVTAVALTFDGRRLASGSEDGTIRLWDPARGEARQTFSGHVGGVTALALSADGQVLASGGRDGPVRVWDTATGRLRKALPVPRGLVYSVALSGGGQRLAAGGPGREVLVWDLTSDAVPQVFRGNAGGVNALAFATDGQTLASAHGAGQQLGMIYLWNVAEGRQLETLVGEARLPATAAAFSPDGQTLVSGDLACGRMGMIHLWNVAEGRRLEMSTFAARTADSNVVTDAMSMAGRPITFVAVSNDNNTVVFGSGGVERRSVVAQAELAVLDLAGGKARTGFKVAAGTAGEVTGLTLTRDGRVLAAAVEDRFRMLQGWDLPEGTRHPLAGWPANALFLPEVAAFSEDGRLLAVVDGFGGIMVREAAADGRAFRFGLAGREGQTGGSSPLLAFAPGGWPLAWVNRQTGAAEVWDWVTGEKLRGLAGREQGPTEAVGFTADGKGLVCVGRDGTVRLWGLGTGKVQAVAKLALPDRTLTLQASLAAGGKVLATAANTEGAEGRLRGAVQCWDLSLPTLPGPGPAWLAPAQTPNEQALAAIRRLHGRVERDTARRDRPVTILDLKGTGVTDADLEHLKALPYLRRLVLSGTAVSDRGMAYIPVPSGVEHLYLDDTRVTAAGLKPLRTMPRLHVLDFSRTAVGDESLAQLEKLPDLSVLGLFGTAVTDTGLKSLGKLAGLHVLNLGNTKVTDAGLASLAGLTKLEDLNLDGTTVTDAGLKHLANLPNLRTLSLRGTGVTDKGLAHLAKLSLLALYLADTKVAGPGLAHLPEGLAVLDLAGTPTTDEGLTSLEKLPGLTVLNLSRTRVTDASLLQVLRDLIVLQHLFLDDTRVTDAGLAPNDAFGRLELKSLSVRRTAVTTASLKKLAPVILQTLSVNATMSDADYEDLQRTLPQTEVVRGPE